jgi:hypothetical protein
MVRFLNDVFNEQAIARRKKKFLFHLLSPPNKTDAPRAIFERSISIFCLQSRQAEIIKADGVPSYVSEKPSLTHPFKLKELAKL